MNDSEKSFTQAAAEFQRLKEQFKTGSLSEVELKTQLQNLMVQDEQGYWWMIGYETGQWYRHVEATGWEQADPPGIVPQETPPPLISSPAAESIETDSPPIESSVVAKEEPVIETFISPAIELSVKPASSLRNRFWRGLGLVIVLSLLNLCKAFIYQYFLTLGFTGPLFAVINPLSSIFFGPWVGGFVNMFSYLSSISLSVLQYETIDFQPLPIFIDILLAFFWGMIPVFLVKDARNWRATLAVGGLFSAIKILGFAGLKTYYFNINNLLLNNLLPYFILLPLFAWLLAHPLQRWGWYWRDFHLQVYAMNKETGLTIFFISIGWCLAWGIPISIGDNARIIDVGLEIAGLLSGLTLGVVLWWRTRALRWYHLLLIMAGWGLGIMVALDTFVKMSWNGPIEFIQWFLLAVAGLIGGFMTGLMLRWVKFIICWRQVWIIAANWAIALVLGEILAIDIIPWLRTGWDGSTVARYFVTGLLTGAVGAGIMFWALRKNLPVEK
jgi:hypothetical protein